MRTQLSLSLYTLSYMIMAEFGGCNGNDVTHKAKNIYYLALHGKIGQPLPYNRSRKRNSCYTT